MSSLADKLVEKMPGLIWPFSHLFCWSYFHGCQRVNVWHFGHFFFHLFWRSIDLGNGSLGTLHVLGTLFAVLSTSIAVTIYINLCILSGTIRDCWCCTWTDGEAWCWGLVHAWIFYICYVLRFWHRLLETFYYFKQWIGLDWIYRHIGNVVF